MTRRHRLIIATLALSAVATGAWAQEVVQPLPPAGSDALNSALRRLANNPRDVFALIDAGEAALKVGDIDAAMGFYGRARDLAPENARIKLGMATAFARSRRSIEALRLFAEAEKLGVDRAVMAADRGLAFDLVGDAASAQQNYRLALTRTADPELTRRLALSQAIAKDKRGFEATLLPLLQQGDLAAFRTRAFGLAILGETDAAVKIAQDMMPREMAARMTPYLRYMPQLTQAQQAAAGNLGIFPRAASLASSGPRNAGTSSAPAVRTADARLEPRGPQLGAGTASTSASNSGSRDPRRRPDRTGSRSDTQTAASPTEIVRVAQATSPPPTARPIAQPSINAGTAAAQTAPPPATPVVVAIQLPTTPAPPPAQVAVPDTDVSLVDAFAGFTLPTTPTPTAAAGAVDITAIRIPREVEKVEAPAAKLAPPKPAKPAHPSRHWVQVATGKNLSALGFDWRKIAKKAEGKLDKKGPFTTPWVEANRLLAGPYDSAGAAREMVKTLKALGIDSFTFASAEGEEIKPLK